MVGETGRADLIRAWAAGKEDAVATMARLAGYALREERPKRPSIPPSTPASGQDRQADQEPPSTPPALTPEPLQLALLWRPTSYRWRSVRPRTVSEELETAELSLSLDRPEKRPITPWPALLPELQKVLSTREPGYRVDVDRFVHRLGRGEPMQRMPVQKERFWVRRLQILDDRSRRLMPYWSDQIDVADRLDALLPDHAVDFARISDGLGAPVRLLDDGTYGDYVEPEANSVVLVLGDLGCLAKDGGEASRFWQSFGQRLVEVGARPMALIPCGPDRWARELSRDWTLIPWDRLSYSARLSPEGRQSRMAQLLALLSPALEIEPGLIRDIRQLLPDGDADAALEADLLQSGALRSTASVSATLARDRLARHRGSFREEARPLQQAAVERIRSWRTGRRPSVWYAEIAGLGSDAEDILGPYKDDLSAAAAFMEALAPSRDPSMRARVQQWVQQIEDWLPPVDMNQASAAEKRLNRALNGLRAASAQAGAKPLQLADFDVGDVEDPDDEPTSFTILQRGSDLNFVGSSAATSGSCLGSIETGNRLVQIDTPFWASGSPPSWAANWGTDAFGAWVTFKVAGPDVETVSPTMRWIPPGSFLMGSPANEEGRFDDEDPRHEVTFARGFWLFETPCTQTLWQAVMGENPSGFKGDDRPVEKVSWHDARAFIDRLNELLPGLSLDLPSEAQWEYACRAGTTTAYSYGDRADVDFMNFDESKIGETSSVHRYPPNPWGLRDMHGNVWEWCLDHWHENYEGAPTGGSAWLEGEASGSRVMRGGSWLYDARRARAASRSRYAPVERDVNVGFRCARGQASDREAEPAGPASWRKAEPRHAQEPTGGAAAVIRLAEGEPRISHPLPDAPSILIRSDREELTLSRLTKPDWASAIGRDRLGLYARFSVQPEIKRGGFLSWFRRLGFLESAALASPRGRVTQTIRWIPPGRFMMGSPESEAGRFGDERPQHEVTLEEGFWLFDTPCTQALWGAVMGENPSRFKSPDRPVEMVSWNDAQEFIEKLNDRIDGLGLSLPSEAQWEYACRGGTTTSSYAGEVEFLGENNAPLLDDIAWYSGNSGVDFDLEEGYDSSDWKEKQYPHEKTGTREVGQKLPNAFGLHDMLGNVWEWCADPWHESYEGAPTDGSVWDDGEATGFRVLRGGSWICRCAERARGVSPPGAAPPGATAAIGFRCARGQA